MQYPFAGSRMMRDLLNRQGHHIGRRHTRTLMKKMGINALYCKPNLSQANQAHRKYPYLLKGLAIAGTKIKRNLHAHQQGNGPGFL